MDSNFGKDQSADKAKTEDAVSQMFAGTLAEIAGPGGMHANIHTQANELSHVLNLAIQWPRQKEKVKGQASGKLQQFWPPVPLQLLGLTQIGFGGLVAKVWRWAVLLVLASEAWSLVVCGFNYFQCCPPWAKVQACGCCSFDMAGSVSWHG